MSSNIATAEKYLTLAEYLDLEDRAEVKHEFDNGKAIEMSGAKFEHNLISAQIIGMLLNLLNAREKTCSVLTGDMKIYLPLHNKAVYPDVTVVCEKPEFWNDRRDLILNPVLVIEVLSESTESYDRGEKFNQYCSLPSLREYVLVSEEKAQVESFYLHDPEANLWKITRAAGLESSIDLPSVGVKLLLKDLYKGIEFPGS